jgi:hypothetical protein
LRELHGFSEGLRKAKKKRQSEIMHGLARAWLSLHQKAFLTDFGDAAP